MSLYCTVIASWICTASWWGLKWVCNSDMAKQKSCSMLSSLFLAPDSFDCRWTRDPQWKKDTLLSSRTSESFAMDPKCWHLYVEEAPWVAKSIQRLAWRQRCAWRGVVGGVLVWWGAHWTTYPIPACLPPCPPPSLPIQCWLRFVTPAQLKFSLTHTFATRSTHLPGIKAKCAWKVND